MSLSLEQCREKCRLCGKVTFSRMETDRSLLCGSVQELSMRRNFQNGQVIIEWTGFMKS